MIYLGNLFVFMLLFNLILPNFGLSQVSAQGESTRNPFLTLREQRCGSAIKTRKPIGFFYLQGVFIKPDKKIALINGKVVKEGDFIVGGSNFGLGSSREHAPLVIKMVGVSAILAKTVARIFFRNAINLGLLVLICDTDQIDDGDELEVDLAAGTVRDTTNGNRLTFGKIPEVMLHILEAGGLIPYIKKYGGFRL